MIITDRSAIETLWKCPRRYFWNRVYGEQGLTTNREEEALVDGIGFHEDFALVAESDIPKYPTPPPPDAIQEEWERFARRVGTEHAYRNFIFREWILSHYEIVAVEKEMVLEREGIWVAFTPDLILRSKTDGRLVNIDFKSVGRVTREWAESWPYAIQLHFNGLGIEEEYEEPVSHSLVIGIDKGYRKDGKIRHPYTWAYTNGEGVWQPDYKRDWFLAPIWERDDVVGTIRDWVNKLGPDVAKGLFPVSLPIVTDKRLAEEAVKQVRDEIIHYQEEEKEKGIAAYPQRFSQCRPSIGPACPFLACCHNADVGRDPLGSGLYKVRIPHHDVWGLNE